MQLENQQTNASKNRLDLDIVRKKSRRMGTYIAIVGTAFVLPIVIILISAVSYVILWLWGVQIPSRIALLLRSPILIDSLSILLAWLFLAVLYFLFTAIHAANSQNYNSFLKRFYQFDVRLQLLDFDLQIESGIFSEKIPAHKIDTERNESEYKTQSSGVLIPNFDKIGAYLYRNIIYNKLTSKKINRVQTNDYLNLWKLIYLGEEALIEISPRTEVIRQALHDRSCMKDSNIDNRDELINKLMLAARVLDALTVENFPEFLL